MAIALVQTVSGNEKIAVGSAYQNVYTFSITPTAGNTLILSLAYGAADTITVSDNKGNTWVNDKAQILVSQRQATIWRASNVAAGATTITIQANSGQFPDSAYICDEFSGLATSLPLDQTQGANTSSGTSYPAGSVTTLQANELLIGCIASDSDTPAYTGDASWNTITTQGAGDLFTSVARQYRIVSSTGTYSWTVTNGTSRQVSQAVATYKMAAAASSRNSNFFAFF